MQIFACGNASQNQPLARRSFFRCSTTQLKWNHGSTGLLVVVQSDVDKTNQSYYGESKLCYLTTDGKHEGLVPLRMFLLLLKELIIDCIISIRITSSSFSKKKIIINWQGKRVLFMMLSGLILAWNLLLYMDVSFSLWLGDKPCVQKFPLLDICWRSNMKY